MSSELDTQSAGASEPTPPALPGYRVGRFLGGGASGLVWAVTRESDDARLAAKVLMAPADEACGEVAVLQRIRHDHVLRVHDSVLDLSEATPRLVMITDLAEGGSLGAAIEGRGHFTPGEVVTVLTPLARALHDLHGQGLVHGDLSPANVLLSEQGKPLLADFGVARLVAGVDAEVWGSPGFVAPEVLAGDLPEPASDVYALGALAWTALVGAAPAPAALREHLPDVAPQAPRELCDLVLACLSHTPSARPEAGDLALGLWDSATAAPAPMAGSDGARTAPQQRDPWSGLTQRIREAALEPEHSAEPLPWHRQPMTKRILVATALAGMVGGGAVVWPDAPQQIAHGAMAAEPQQRPVSVRAPAVTSAPKATPRQVIDLRRGARGVVQGLVDARARAWGGETSGLDHAFVAQSAGWRRDAGELRKATSLGARYRGLRFDVRQVRLLTVTADRATAQVTVDRSAYRVEGAVLRTVPARAGERVMLELRHTGGGWRIADWRAA